ncbi:MAG TPA: ParB N-terminal domain-containing protein [Anaerolineae bacterium]|nr:ParB N-terminal domain-containing protein [Anaerolineae bacterium]
MAKKKTSLSQTLFGQIDPYGSVPEVAETTPTGSQAALPLEAIRPDRDQPRQLLPLALSQALAAGRLTPAEALRSWLSQAEATDPDGVMERPVRELRRLATSIAQHGLINPITVRQPHPDEALPSGVEYVIVTGERRYWSHILLSLEGRSIREGAETSQADQIKAVIVQTGISVRAHQLIENLMREDINAVEKARGLWALRYELSGVNHGSPSANTSEPSLVNHSSPAQSNSEPELVPWSQVEETLDISKRYRIFITGVLDLSPQAQTLVAAQNLSERSIRPIVQKLKAQPELQIQALQQLIQWRKAEDTDSTAGQPIIGSTEALVAQLLAQAEAKSSLETGKKSSPVIRRSLETEQFRNKVQSALRFLNKLEEPDVANLTQNLATGTQYAGVVEELRDLRERIDTILEAVAVYSSQNGPGRSN